MKVRAPFFVTVNSEIYLDSSSNDIAKRVGHLFDGHRRSLGSLMWSWKEPHKDILRRVQIDGSKS
jgi:hypothetical protein